MKPAASQLFEILYVSTFSLALPTESVRQIAINSRVSNIERGVTGILIFDGLQFCQFLEGPKDVVCSLLAWIARDKRHNKLKVLCQGTVSKRKFGDFSMGLATLGDDEEFLQELTQMKGRSAMKKFMSGVEGLGTVD